MPRYGHIADVLLTNIYSKLSDVEIATLSSIGGAPQKKKITKHELEWNSDGTLKTLKAYQETDLLYSIDFEWNPDGTMKTMTRSEP